MDILKNKFIIFGHRGAPKYSPENTIISFKKAIELGVHAIELDILLTNDNKIIVFHDLDLNRIAGINKKVCDLNYNELSKIDVSNKWNKHFGFQKIPLLEDVILIAKSHNIILNIEIKSTRIIPTKIVNKVAEIIQKHQIENQCIISSFNPLILRKMKNIYPNIFTSLIWSKDEVYFIQKFYKLLYWIAKPDGFHPDNNFINKNLLSWAKLKNLLIYVFTVNSKDELIKLKSWGVNGIITDDPKIVL